MKVCLVRPKFPVEDSKIYPPLGLLTIAPYFGESASVAINDCQISECGFLSAEYDVIAFSAFTVQLPIVDSLIKQGKSSGLNCKFVVGGPGVTSNIEYAKKLVPNADLLFAGEGEYFAEKVKEVLIEGKKVVDMRKYSYNLGNKKIPAWNLTNYKLYRETLGFGVETSRGCPFNCVMCTAHLIHGKQWRSRKPSDVVAELKYLKQQYGCNRFYFSDDNATADISRWADLMCEIADAKLGISLSVPEGIQAHKLQLETLKLMKAAGLTNFTIGAESGVQRILDDVICKGGLTVEKIEEVVKMAKQLDMKPSCFFVIGFPGETSEEAKATVNFAEKLRRLGAESCAVRNVIPMPGTRLFELAKAKGYFTVPEEQLFNFNFVHSGKHLLKTPDWKPEQIEALVAKAKLQEGKHYLNKHPAVLVKHPRASLRLIMQRTRKQ